MFELKATLKTNEKPETLRADGFVPAVCYGSGKENVSIFVSEKEFTKVFREAGETSTISIMVDGKKIPTLVHEIQREAVRGTPTHIDFYIVDMKKEIEVAVPIEFIGLADAEKTGLGNVVKVLHEIEVRALPDHLPHSVEVDVTGLATLEDKIHVSDIKLPTGVTCVTEGEEVVALVASFVEEKEETPVDLSAIEVVEKGKKEEDAEAAPDA